MPAYEHHFMPLDPPPASAEEREAVTTLATLNYDTLAGETLVVRFMGTTALGVQTMAVTLPEAVRDHADRNKWFRQIMETSVASIRLSYDPNAQPFFTGTGFLNVMYESDDPEPSYPLVIQPTVNPNWRLNENHVLGVFGAIHGKVKSDVAALLAEAQVHSLPVHYSVLSLMRAIELLWPEVEDRNVILDAREEEFAAIAISDQLFRNALSRIRNRCAHGRGRGRDEPFVGLGYNSPLYPLKKLLGSIVSRGLRDNFGIEMAEEPA